MKKFLLSAVGVLLSVGAVTVDARSPFLGFSKGNTTKERKAVEPRKPLKVSKLRPSNAPVKMTIDPKDMVDKSMLTSYKATRSYTDVDEPKTETGTYTYDEYGFPKTVTDSYGDVYTYEYTWREPGRVWSSRSITYKGETSTKTRTFHPNGMVESETEGQFFRRYDENGYLIEETNSYEGYYETRTFTYSPITKEWYVGMYNPDNKDEYTVTDNSITRTSSRLINGVWYPTSIYAEYYDQDGQQCGYLDKSYVYNEGEGNAIAGGSGSKYETYTEDGKIITIDKYFDWPNDAWRSVEMTVKSANYDDPYIYKPGEERYQESYTNSNDDNTFSPEELRQKTVLTWVADRIMKEEYFYYSYDEHDIDYILVSEDGTDTDYIAYNPSNGSYCVDSWDENTDYYTFYDANHNVLEEFREKENNNLPATWEKKNGDVWEKCTGTLTVWSNSDEKYVIVFDDQGRMIRQEEWEYGLLDEYTTYTYDADGKGWQMSDYSVDSETSTERKYSDEAHRIHDDGSIEEWELDYSLDGSVWGYKRIYYPNRAIKEFSYKDGDWVFMNWRVESSVTNLPDGFIETISYTVDENGNVRNVTKFISKDISDENVYYEYRELYSWDTQNSSWVGEAKSIIERNATEESSIDYVWSSTKNEWYPEAKYLTKIVKFPDIEYIAPVDPLVINEEYFFPINTYPTADNTMRVQKNYMWDPEIGDLKLTFAEGEEYEKISDKEVKIIDYCNFNDEGIKTYSFKLDDKLRVIENKNKTWAYNEFDQVIEHNIKPYSTNTENSHYEYTYSIIKVWSGIDEIAGENAEVVATYNLAGLAVDSDKLASGVYIQKLSDGSSRKIVVK